MIAVLHTYGQNLHCQPHIHLLVTAGGLTDAGDWKLTGEDYFLPVKALSAIYRAKCFAAFERFEQDLPATQLPRQWVVHARAPQKTPDSILLYLARYIYRVAIDESRIQSVDTKKCHFPLQRLRDHSKSKSMTLSGQEFLRRSLQHILPTGFVKVRHYGIFAHSTKAILALLTKTTAPAPLPRCPHCKSQNLIATEVPPQPQPLGDWALAP